MTTSPGKYLRSVFHLGSGEALGRVANVAIVMLLGHRFGVVVLGIYSLGTTLSAYMQPAIDFGLKHIGARLVAQFPASSADIVRRVQRRRAVMATVALPLIAIYAGFTSLPLDMKVFLFVFAGIAALYAVSLEWVAWGKEQLWLVGWSKAVVPISILMFLAAGSLHGQSIFRWAIAGNAAGYILQSILFWIWWRRHRTDEEGTAEDRDAIRDALAWRRTSVMGLAWFSNLAFVSVDMLMLGLLANAEQVGLYSAAYRVLNQVLVTYYLFVNALYPRFAQHSLKQRLAMLRVHILLPLFGVGVAVAALVTVFRRPVLTVLFGQGFVASAPLLLVLACAIPVDFLVSYLSSAYIAWSMERHMLKCALLAAGTDVVLNLYGIPRYGAMAAAVNTVISYLVYLAALSFVARRVSRAGDTLPQTA